MSESPEARRLRQLHEKEYERALRQDPEAAQRLLDRYWEEARKMRAGAK
jgi:regulator of protease activity HflC (stomatin/prohibitin superfamily)